MTTRRVRAGWRAGREACRTRRSTWRCLISRLRRRWRIWRSCSRVLIRLRRRSSVRMWWRRRSSREYYDADKNCYAFSRNADGTLDQSEHGVSGAGMVERVAGGQVGTGSSRRMPSAVCGAHAEYGLGSPRCSSEEKIYDGMSYHQGSVWPLFTGWAALAEYRANQPLAGYRMLMENANLTRAQDLGAETELLSGDFYVPFGRSTSHQLWSCAMVITPTLRGLFGISIDAQTKTITVNPHLPAGWEHAEVKNIHVPSGTTSLYFTRNSIDSRFISVHQLAKDGICVATRRVLPSAHWKVARSRESERSSLSRVSEFRFRHWRWQNRLRTQT